MKIHLICSEEHQPHPDQRQFNGASSEPPHQSQEVTQESTNWRDKTEGTKEDERDCGSDNCSLLSDGRKRTDPGGGEDDIQRNRKHVHSPELLQRQQQEGTVHLRKVK